jgi:hypothetical protein
MALAYDTELAVDGRWTVTQRTIRTDVFRHETTGLLLAVSDDLKGLYVHGRNTKELSERIPIAIKAILESNGEGIFLVAPVEQDDIPAGFVPPRLAFDARLASWVQRNTGQRSRRLN